MQHLMIIYKYQNIMTYDIHYHGPHESCIITGRPQNQLITLPLSSYEEEWLLLKYYLSTCLSWSFVLMRCGTLTWVTKILMRAISNVHPGHRFPTP